MARSALSRDVGALRQAAAERGVLAGDLVEHDHQVCRGYSGGRYHFLIKRLEQSQARLLRTSSYECQLKQDHGIGVSLSKEGRRVKLAVERQDMGSLKEIIGRDPEFLNQTILNRLPQLDEAGACTTPL